MADQIAQLIRLRTWELDEKRRDLSAILAEIAGYRQKLSDLEDELSQEQKVAAAAPVVAGFNYGAYAEEVINRRRRIKEDIIEAEGRADLANEEVSECFRELKKAERTMEIRDQRETERLARLDQAEMDELARNMHRHSDN